MTVVVIRQEESVRQPQRERIVSGASFRPVAEYETEVRADQRMTEFEELISENEMPDRRQIGRE